MMCFLCLQEYADLESFPSSSMQERADSSRPFICLYNTNIMSPWDELLAGCPCVGLRVSLAHLGQAGAGGHKDRGWELCRRVSPPRAQPLALGPFRHFKFVFSTSVFHKHARCLCRHAAPLGCVLNAEAPC